MHIPDNYLSPSTCAAFGVVMIPVWKRTVAKVKKEITKKKMPMLGICSAFSFLIMMFNLPLPGGSTGHAVGAALIAILLGPYAATISVTIALVIQALFFSDGGILAIGANCFNMAFVMPFSAYYIYNFTRKMFRGKKGEKVAVLLAGYISLNLAAFCAAIEFGIQPILFKDATGAAMYCPYGLSAAIPSMVGSHLLVAGLIEAFVTLGVYSYVKKVDPNFIYQGSEVKSKPMYGLLIGMIVLCPIGLLATGTAWGEWAPEEVKDLVGFIPKGMEKGFNFNSIMPDYSMAGLSEAASYIISALAGVAIILIIFKILNSRRNRV